MTTPTPPAAGFEFLAEAESNREDVLITTASIADGATDVGMVTMAPGWRLYWIETSAPCRTRLYASTAQRTADAARPVGTDPPQDEDHGLFFEFVSDSGIPEAVLSPMVDGYCPAGISVPYAITNMSGGTTVLDVTLTFIRTE